MNNNINKIIDRVYVSDHKCANSNSMLIKHNIKYIVRLIQTNNDVIIPGIYYMCIDLNNINKKEFMQKIISILQFMKTCYRENRGNILVHCYYGMSTSIAVMTSFIMILRNIKSVEAYDIVKKSHKNASLNEKYKRMLIYIDKARKKHVST